MTKKDYFPQKVYIEEASLAFPLTWRVLKNLGDVPQEIIPHPKIALENLKSSQDPIGEGKKYLLLAQKKGDFIKPCPCTPHYVGCNYFIIHSELNCPLECSYCILQHYLNNPLITVHVNLEELWRQLDIFLEKKKMKILRMGTGELSDSLALDHLTENSLDMISHFKEKKNVLFEMKTKTTNIKNILAAKPAENIVISWSLNTSKIAQEEERQAAPVEERIEAAREVSKRGFWLGFHFDPLIRYSGWEEDYAQLVEKLLTEVPPAKICWISLGSLRFPPLLKNIIKSRFPRTKIIYDEFILGKDGKFRYFKPLRLELYKRMIKWIKDCGGSKIPLYFCMESKEIWKEAMSWMPRGKEDVESFLSPQLRG